MKKFLSYLGRFEAYLIPKNIFGSRIEDNEFTRDDPKEYDNSFMEEEICGIKYVRRLGFSQFIPIDKRWEISDFARSKLEQAAKKAKRKFGEDVNKVKITIIVTRLDNGSYRHNVRYEKRA